GPGIVAELALSGDRKELPQHFAGFGVVCSDMAATLVLAARGSDDDFAVDELRRHRLGPRVLPSIDGHLPGDMAVAGVQSDQCGVQLSDEDLAGAYRDASIRLPAADREL